MFEVKLSDVTADRCSSLKPPARGLVMCSAASSDDDGDVTTCRLVCPPGLTLPRPADRQLTVADQFHCRRDVGVWTPTDRLPSCVGPFVSLYPYMGIGLCFFSQLEPLVTLQTCQILVTVHNRPFQCNVRSLSCFVCLLSVCNASVL